MFLNKTIAILFLILTTPQSFAEVDGAGKYTFKDLEVLEKENNFNEFIAHAFDIRPSERTKYWKKMFDHMATLSIDEKIKNKDFSVNTFLSIEKLNQYPILKNDEVFQFKRNLYALKYFKECYISSLDKKSCDKQLETYWEDSDKDPDMALEYVTLLEFQNSSLETWPFYKKIIHDPAATVFCRRSNIQKAIFKKINLGTFDENFDNDYKNLALKLVPEKCLRESYSFYKEVLTSNHTNAVDKELALSLLWDFKLLSVEEKDFYLSLFLFTGPVVGDKMNLAWKLVESLSENFIRRSKILEKFKALNFIPDKIFIDPNIPRNKAIISLFAKNFPELLNYYGEDCIDLLKGNFKGHASSGHQCQQFLSKAQEIKKIENNNWVSDSIRTNYSALKK